MSDVDTTTGFDVIVLGAGAAGVWAAYHAAQAGARVAVLAKGAVGRAGATVSSGGRIAVCGQALVEELGLDADVNDTRARFFDNIMKAGGNFGDPALARALVEGIGRELRILQQAGVDFPVTPGGIGRGPGSSVRTPGPELQRIMNRLAVKAGVQFWEDFHAVELLHDGAAVTGVAGVSRRTGTIEIITAPAIVLATGGATANWLKRDTPEDLAGDGQAMALRAGAALVDPDFVQFLPCCVLHPQLWRGQQFAWRIMGPQGGISVHLLNRQGERFMARWAPQEMEFASSDIVSLAVATEIAEGRGSPGGGVYLSWAHLPQALLADLPLWHDQVTQDWSWQGHDVKGLKDVIFADGAVEIAPVAHCALGGVRVDVEGETGVSGLFACGEVTGGLHGADRLQGAAISQALVQGRAAGLGAARRAAGSGGSGNRAPDDEAAVRARIAAPLKREEGIAPHKVRSRLVALTDAALGPRRTPQELDRALSEVQAIAAEDLPRIACRTRDPLYNHDWAEALDCVNATLSVEAMLLAARVRAGQDGLWNGVVTLSGGELRHVLEER